MPSHFGNWMKDERKKIQARNKRVETMLKYAELGKTVNYELKKEDSNVKEHQFNELSSTRDKQIK
jgi:hypothetical protein